MELIYKNPRKVEGSCIWATNTHFVSNHGLKKLNSSLEDKGLLLKLVKKYGEKLFLPSGDKKTENFLIWFSRIKKWDNQRRVNTKFSISSKKSYLDKENNNTIDIFDFSDRLGKEIHLKVDFRFDAYETTLKIGSGKSTKIKKDSILYTQYTKSEKYLEQTEEIAELAKRIVGKEEDYFKQAKKVFDWIVKNIKYKFPPHRRGVIPTLEHKSGDCGEFNHIFIALCRSLGIPARSVLGMWAVPTIQQGYHAWAEFYLERVGWIPVDCSVAQGLKTKNDEGFVKFIKEMKNSTDPNYYFSNLDNKRIIFSKGNNILLQDCPTDFSLEMMRGSRSLFMQPTSIYPYIGGSKKGIFIVDINQELHVLANK